MLVYKNIAIHTDSCRVTYREREVNLYPQAYRLLVLFLEHPDRMWSYKAIMEKLWDDGQIPSYSTVRSHIKDLRKALRVAGVNEEIIENVHGKGYRLKLFYQEAQQNKGNFEQQEQINRSLEIMSC